MPRFITYPALKALAWLITEAVINHVDKRLDALMAQVSVDSDVLTSLTTLAQTVDQEVKDLLANPNLNIQPGDVSGIQAALTDANSAVQAAASAAGAPAPAPVGDGSGSTDAGAGATAGTGSTDTSGDAGTGDTSAAPPVDTSGTPGTTVDPTAGAPADGTTGTDATA